MMCHLWFNLHDRSKRFQHLYWNGAADNTVASLYQGYVHIVMLVQRFFCFYFNAHWVSLSQTNCTELYMLAIFFTSVLSQDRR